MISEKHQPAAPSTGPSGPPLPTARGCPQCGAGVPAEGPWCPACGLQVSDPCWECGLPLAERAAFCSRCGTPATEPAVIACPQCRAVVGRQQGFCPACGAQARPVCAECERPLRREWAHCPACGGEPAWAGGEGAATRAGASATIPRVEDAEATNEEGIHAYEREDFAEAVRLFRGAIAADPTRSRYYLNLGVALGELGDDLAAFTAYRRAVELDPGEVAAYLNMGYLYMDRERHSEAREMWEKVIALAPDGDEAAEARRTLQKMDEV